MASFYIEVAKYLFLLLALCVCVYYVISIITKWLKDKGILKKRNFKINFGKGRE